MTRDLFPDEQSLDRAHQVALWFMVLWLVSTLIGVAAWSARSRSLHRTGAELSDVQGRLARSEMLVKQISMDNRYLETENLRLNGEVTRLLSEPAKVHVVYRCEEKRTPVFEKEWTYR